MSKFFKFFAAALLVVVAGFAFTSCHPDPKPTPNNSSLVGTWTLTETEEDEDEIDTVEMTLIFKNDQTGSIKENWRSESRSVSLYTYEMKFSWSTVSDSDGNQILQVSYISGDKNTEIFMGSSNTALWKRQYVLTGKILNIYGGDGVWVFNKK